MRLPKGVEFTHIKKEKDCQGRLILIYEEDGEDACWLSQSMPAVVQAINNVVSRPKRLHCSSAYRILRAESLSHVHKTFMSLRTIDTSSLHSTNTSHNYPDVGVLRRMLMCGT